MAETETLTPAIQEYLESLYWLGEAGIESQPAAGVYWWRS